MSEFEEALWLSAENWVDSFPTDLPKHKFSKKHNKIINDIIYGKQDKKIKMELQKEKSKTYETVETWTNSKTGTVLAMSESRNINVLCKYRLKVTFTAGKETEVVYKYWWTFNILHYVKHKQKLIILLTKPWKEI